MHKPDEKKKFYFCFFPGSEKFWSGSQAKLIHSFLVLHSVKFLRCHNGLLETLQL